MRRMDQGAPTIPVSSADGEPHLLVIAAGRSFQHPLAARGSWVVGRGEDADVRVEDASVSRRHARLELDDVGASVHDLGSHNGTRLNGVPIQGAARVVSGDVIALGEATLVPYLGRRPGWRREVLAPDILERLDVEADRATRFERPLVAIAFAAPGAPLAGVGELLRGALRPCDALGVAGDELLLGVFPELGPEEAEAVARRIIAALTPFAGPARAGIASCPADGIDGATLWASARDALASAAGRPDEAGHQLTIGDRGVVVADPAMRRIYDLLRRLAASDLAVLLTGETGSGKEVAAHAVHAWSKRARGPFVAVNCATLPEHLVESELFGYRKGAFSGADRDKVGLFETAAAGTLFLDEVGELPPAAQAKLLRALDGRQIVRLGDVSPITVDARVVAATNRDLDRDVAAGRFREDLFYRLNAARVIVPPLRDRPRDIPALARALLARAAAGLGRPAPRLSDATLRQLIAHRFAGNVRELGNAMDYAAALADDTVEPWHLPPALHAPQAASPSPAAEPALRFRPIGEEIEELEKRRMTEALAATGGNQSRAADLIAMPRRTFVTKMGRYGLRASAD